MHPCRAGRTSGIAIPCPLLVFLLPSLAHPRVLSALLLALVVLPDPLWPAARNQAARVLVKGELPKTWTAATAMPLPITDAGPPGIALRVPVSAGAPDRALQPGADAIGAGIGETIDAMAISAAAHTRQALGASVLGMQWLGFLLEWLEQVIGLAAPGDPTILIELAVEVGAAAQEISLSLAAEGDAPAPTPAGEPLVLPAGVASASPGSVTDVAPALRALAQTDALTTARSGSAPSKIPWGWIAARSLAE